MHFTCCSISQIQSCTIKSQWQNNKRCLCLLFQMAYSWLAYSFPNGLFKALRSQYRWCETSGKFNRTACIQCISQALTSSCVDWCGGLFGIWLELEVHTSECLFSNWILVATTHLYYLSLLTHPCISATPSAMRVEASKIKQH